MSFRCNSIPLFFVCFFFCSVKTNLTNIGANSTLFVAKVNKQDSGSYTCSIGPNQHYSVSVHVLNGEFASTCYITILTSLRSRKTY